MTDATDPRGVLRGLRAALNGSGPAVRLGAPADSGRGPSVGADSERSPDADLPPGATLVVTTSGSTGVPKSVVLSRHALTASAMATAARIGDGAWLLALPAHYIAGVQVLVRSLVQGREPAVLSGRFSPAAFVAAATGMRSSRGGAPVPAYTSLVPAQLQTLVEAAADDGDVRRAVASFEAVLVGGQALPPALRERAADLGVRVVRTYGSTETAGGCVYDGVPLDGVRVAAVDGELRIAGPTLADGYLGDPARTGAVFPADAAGARWYRTGDAGELVDGVVRVTGRIDNVIVSGGVNVSLDRVELIVRGIAGLEHAVVVGVPDERWGEASVVVVPAPPLPHPDPADPELLAARAAVEAAVGKPARPARLLRVPAIPQLPSGKPDRAALRALAR